MKNILSDRIQTLIVSLSLIIMITISSCTPWDDYRKYTDEGEIVYPGIVKSLEFLPGENRVRMIGTLGSDVRVTDLKVFWNDYKDSVEIAVTPEIRASGFDEIINVSEGLRSFVVYTYDDLGNKSLGVNEIGTSYGDRYRAKIHNKTVNKIWKTDSSTFLIWNPIDLSTGAHIVHVDYHVAGEMKSVETIATRDSTELKGLIVSDTIDFHTIYLPSYNCIDQFYTDTTAYILTR